MQAVAQTTSFILRVRFFVQLYILYLFVVFNGQVLQKNNSKENYNRLQQTAPFSHPKPKKKPRYPYRNRKKPNEYIDNYDSGYISEE